MDHFKFITSNQKEEPISALRDKLMLVDLFPGQGICTTEQCR